MTRYSVHVYCEMRLVYPGVEAAHGKLSRFVATRPPTAASPPGEPEPTRAELLRFLTDFVAFGYAPGDIWPGMDLRVRHARHLLRQSKGRRPA